MRVKEVLAQLPRTLRHGAKCCMRPAAADVFEPELPPAFGIGPPSSVKDTLGVSHGGAPSEEASTVPGSEYAAGSSASSSPAFVEAIDAPSFSGYHRAFDHVSQRSFAHRLTKVLERFAAKGEHRDGRQTCFSSGQVPSISLSDYVERLVKYTMCSRECFVIALTYIERIRKHCKSIELSALTIHRLFATALVIATKYQDDTYRCNNYYAEVAGVSLKELNSFEVTMLDALHWDANVKCGVFNDFACLLYPEHV